MRKISLIIISITFVFTFLIHSTAQANQAERDFEPDKDDIVNSYSFGPYNSDKWSLKAVDTPNINNPGAGVTIAIIDTGVTKTANLACHNFVHEYDSFWFISGPGSAQDIDGHGTIVAHTIADCNDGIAKSVNIMPIRAFTDYYSYLGVPMYADDWSISEGIYWAVNHGADIINMSLGSSCYQSWYEGCKGDPNYPGWVDAAIDYAVSNGVLVVAASGNEALPWVSHPANHPNVWAVGAVDINLDQSYFSNTGEALTFVGPGENIETALGNVDGTSFSSPEVAAAAAVLKGSMPGLTIEEIEGAFICTIVDLGDQGWDPNYGWGLPQINASLDLLEAGLLQTPWWVSDNLILTSVGNGIIRATWEAADDCNGIDSYLVEVEPGSQIKTTNYTNKSIEFSVKESGEYTFTAIATNVFGNNSSIITNSIKVDLIPPTWLNGTEISILQDGENLLYSWNKAFDESGISRYELLVERDGDFVIQENTLNTSLSLDLGYFSDSGIYNVTVSAFDNNENNSIISGYFEIIDEEDGVEVEDGVQGDDSIPSFESVTTTTTIPEYANNTTQTTLPTISDPNTTNTVLGAPMITSTSLSGSNLTIYFEHAPAVKDLEIVAYGCSYSTVENGPAGGIDGFEVDKKSCILNIPTNYDTVYVKAHAKYGNYVNCNNPGDTGSCTQINNAEWGPYTDWYPVVLYLPTTTTTNPGQTYTPTGSLNGSCDLLRNSGAASEPLFKQVNNNLYPLSPEEAAFNGYEGCMYENGITRDQIKTELIRYLDYWQDFTKDEFMNLRSVKTRDWSRVSNSLNDAGNRWSSEWNNINSTSIVNNLSRSDGKLVWDDTYWTVGSTTTTFPVVSDSNTTNTVLGAPEITKITVSGSTITANFEHAPAVKDLEIVAYGCSYDTGVAAGGRDGINVSSKTCSLDFPAQYTTVSIKVHAKYGNYVNCNNPGDTGSCTQINNAEWGPYTEWVTVYLTGNGSISDSNIEFIWDILPMGSGCYPETYPKNKQVNNSLLPFTQAEVRQSLKDYGNWYGRMCSDELVEAYINHWKSKTPDDIRALYPSWSTSVMDKYLNGSGSGYSWDTGWKGEWNSGTTSTTTSTTTTTTSTTTTTIPGDTTTTTSSTTSTTTTTTSSTTSTTTTTTVPDTYEEPYINSAEVHWVGDGEVCLSWGYGKGWTINSQDQSTWVKMSSKTYFNDQLVYEHSPPLGTANGTGFIKISATDGVSYTIRTEIYDRNDQLVQNVNWSSSSSPFIPGQAQNNYPELYYKLKFSPAQSDPNWYPDC